jgi:hypothetical protein
MEYGVWSMEYEVWVKYVGITYDIQREGLNTHIDIGVTYDI